jgi:hypothetical protein
VPGLPQALQVKPGSISESRTSSGPAIGVCCTDYHCSRSVVLSADRWPDDVVRLFTCSACGRRGADVRPDFHWNKPPTAEMGYR